MFRFEQVPTHPEDHRVVIEFEAEHIDDVIQHLKYFLLGVSFSENLINSKLNQDE